MNRRSIYSLGVALLASVLAGPLAGTGHRGRGSSPANPREDESPPVLNSIVGGDFDGDKKPDVIMKTAGGRGWALEVQFTTRMPSALLAFGDAGPGMRIISRDVNRDNDQDLIVTSSISLIPVAVFLGDGKGHFQPDNPWNYVPIALDSPYRFDSPACHEGAVSNTEDRRFPVRMSSGELTDLRLDLYPLPASGTSDPVAWTLVSSCNLRGPPAALPLCV